MIAIKNKSSIAKMAQAGRLLAEIFQELPSLICPGANTADINRWISKELKKRNLVSKSKGYAGYRHESCISVNEEVIHGVPSEDKILTSKDLVKIDVCASWKNYCADMARSFCVDVCTPEAQKLVSVAQAALDAGIDNARSGNHLSDISSAIQQVVEENGFGIVRDFAGHGIGKHLHEEPEVPNYGKSGTGPILRSGMALAIEPMITAGDYNVVVMNDGWTVRSVDKSLTAHVEDTVIVTDGEPKILTRHKCMETKNL
ncbi:type I methionyl aminopeptidase [Candidatus Dependentiae bacterium]